MTSRSNCSQRDNNEYGRNGAGREDESLSAPQDIEILFTVVYCTGKLKGRRQIGKAPSNITLSAIQNIPVIELLQNQGQNEVSLTMTKADNKIEGSESYDTICHLQVHFSFVED